MTAMFTPDAMRARFHQLKAEIKDIETKSAPIRQEYDRVTQTMEAKCKELAAKFKAIEEPLYEKKKELGLLVKALGGKTGNPS
jgi:hypothetical protein